MLGRKVGKRQEAIANYKRQTLRIAKQYKGTDFFNDFENQYIHSYRNGYLAELRKILEAAKSKRIIVERKKNIALAKKYEGNSFRVDEPQAYRHAHTYGYYEIILKFIPEGKTKSSKKRTLFLARKYKGLSFWKDHNTAYMHARRNGYIEEVKQILSKAK